MKNIKHILVQVLILFILFSCEKEENKIINVKGVVQKGPFQTGTNITIYELDNSLNQTGKSFNTTVYDDFGNFEIPNIEIGSNFIEIVADGFYFDERLGRASEDRLVLKTISDLSSPENVNVNILTYLESERVKYLVQTENYGFSDAKNKAEKELLNIFKFETNTNLKFENLNISSEGDLNNMLTAISLILLDNNEASELSKNLTEISFDIKTDGVLNSEKIKTKLITSAHLLNIGWMRKHLATFYNDTSFYGFNNYIDYFIENTDYNSLIKIDYPIETENGKNILKIPENSKLKVDNPYTVSVNFDENQQDFQYTIAIVVPKNTGSLTVTENNLDGWQLDPNYEGRMDETDTYYSGFYVQSNNPANASNNPVNVTFHGTGEILVMLIFEGNILDHRLYYVYKYYQI